MKVVVTRVLFGGVVGQPEPSIAVGFGTTDNGTVGVAFAGEIRPMVEVADALASHSPVVVEVEDWQVLFVTELAKDSEG
ncbi:MAG: hypothetical protein QOJ81_1321 [Chloroflexota bacterium]|nr:hypothetical protein [Chloroflexota bacterium]